MKRTVLFFCAAVLALSLAACGGNVKEVQISTGSSDFYTDSDVSKAVDTVCDYFRKEFEGCTLLELSYEETLSQRSAAEWAAQYGAAEAIVLTSSFSVTGKSDGSLAEGETYKNWQWILVRNGTEDWQLMTWGY